MYRTPINGWKLCSDVSSLINVSKSPKIFSLTGFAAIFNFKNNYSCETHLARFPFHQEEQPVEHSSSPLSAAQPF